VRFTGQLRFGLIMTFRIETSTRERFTVFVLSGRIEKQAIAELTKLCELHTDRCGIVLDLKDVGVIDRDVVCFFIGCESGGVKLENCTSYIREWMEREKIDGGNST
jgi:hypothetical protein